MIKKTIKTAIKITSAVLAFVAMAILVAFLWIYTGPRSVPYMATYLRENISELLPQSISIYVEDVLISFSEDFAIRLKLSDFRIIDDTRGEFTTSDISIIVDPLALFPQTHHNLLNVQINGPALVYSAFKERLNNAPIPVERINDYLNSHKEALLKFSLSLSDTRFDFDVSDTKKAVIHVNEVVLKPTLVKGKLLFALYGDFNIGGKNNVLEATVDTSSNKHLTVKGTATKLSNVTLEEFGVRLPELDKSNIELDLTFTALLRGTRSIEYIEFEGSNFDGLIRENAFFNKDIKISNLKLNGYCSNNCSELHIEKFNISADKLHLKSSMEYKPVSGRQTFIFNFQLDPMPVDMINYYWPKSVIPRTKEWIFAHIKGGKLKSAKGTLHLDFDELVKKRLNHSKIAVNLDLQGTSIKYLPHVDTITNVDGNVNINLDDINFTINKATISNVLIESAKGNVHNLGSSKSAVTIDTKVSGDVQDLIDISFQHAQVANPDLKNINGKAKADLKVSIPIKEEDLELKDLGITGRAKVTNASMKKANKGLTFDKGDFDISVNNFVVDLKGKAFVNNRFNTDISGEYKLLQNVKSIRIKSTLSWDGVAEFGVSKPAFLNNHFDLILDRTESKGEVRTFLTADLRDSTVNYGLLGIKKKIGDPGFLRIMLEDNPASTGSSHHITDYYLSLPGLESKGSGILSAAFDVEKIHSSHTKFGKGDFKFDMSKKDNAYNLIISGNSLDISEVNFLNISESGEKSSVTIKGKKSAPSYKIEAKIARIYLKDDQILSSPVLKAHIDGEVIKELKLSGDLGGDAIMNLNIKYPIISLISSDAGKFSRAFGVSSKIEGGDLNLYGKMDGKNFEGNLEMNDYRMKKAPVMAKIFSVVSITTTSLEGLSNIFTNKGIKFDKLRCPLTLNSGVVTLKGCYAKGPSLTFTADGTINFNTDTVKIKGNVTPENIINTAVTSIPILGSAFKGKTGHALIGASYTVEGPIDDPKARSNPLSILAPGILKDAF